MIHVELCQEARAALASSNWRYNASDLTPRETGAIDANGRRGAFAQGPIPFVRECPSGFEPLLAAIDNAWL